MSRTSSATTSARPSRLRRPRRVPAVRCCAWSTSPTCNSLTFSRQTRFEFLNARFADPRYAEILPVQRPQEALAVHAVDATIRTLGAVHGPATSVPLQLAVTTGDAIDNAQWNELQTFLTLFEGGVVSPDSGGPGYEGVQELDWPGEVFWRPDGTGSRRTGPLPARIRLPASSRPAAARAARVLRGRPRPALVVLLRQPRGAQPGCRRATPGLAAALTGSKKPTEPARGLRP